MCTNCGCAVQPEHITINHQKYSHNYLTETVEIHRSILAKNNHLAENNRNLFQQKNVFTINILSSPGSGKTTFIQKTLTDLKSNYKSAVIVGDLATDNDAKKLQKSSDQVVQITTGDICHLEAEMINKTLQQINLDEFQLLVIENVGNLVCPSAYDLGENQRIAILSVTEGEDKPLKYPTMFKSADVIIINKIDIADAVEFNQDLALDNIKKINPQAQIFMLSAKTGEGIKSWYDYLSKYLAKPVSIA